MIEMYCDHCEELVDESVPGGVRLKLGRREFVFHLCSHCQERLKEQVSKFINGSWRET